MNALIANLIYSSEGKFYETAGVIIAYFSDTDQAHHCADEILQTAGKPVEVCGSQLSISLH